MEKEKDLNDFLEKLFYDNLEKELSNQEFDVDEAYDNALDELYEVNLPSITVSYSELLQKQDPIAYRCGKNDYIDSLGLIEYEYEYYEDSVFCEAEENAKDETLNQLCDILEELRK